MEGQAGAQSGSDVSPGTAAAHAKFPGYRSEWQACRGGRPPIEPEGRTAKAVASTSRPVPCSFVPSPACGRASARGRRSEEHTSELQSLMRTSYADFCLKKNRTDIKKTSVQSKDCKIVETKYHQLQK